MKKIFRVASYDFKRLVFNPITSIVFISLLVLCIILGSIIKIPASEIEQANISGTNASEIYTNFNSTNPDEDTKQNSFKLIEDAKTFLDAQKTSESVWNSYTSTFDDLSTRFQEIEFELTKFHQTGSCQYTESGISPIINATVYLQTFISDYDKSACFETNIFFTTTQFEELKQIKDRLHEILAKNLSNKEYCQEFYANIDAIEKFIKIANEKYYLYADNLAEKLSNEVIKKAEEKCEKIETKMAEISGQLLSSDQQIEQMKSLVTNYKLVCQSAKNIVECELRTALEKVYVGLKNVYRVEEYNYEDEQLLETKSRFYVESNELFYEKYQVPLNFNIGSYEVTRYDYAYLLTSIIGLLVTVFAIFCAYKLFGRDRKAGKVDIVLSQDIKFGQVFAGKFLAIVFTTSFFLLLFASLSLLWGSLFYPTLQSPILAIFNLTNVYKINPLLFFFIKLIGIELQAIFYAVITVFLMNISRKFELCFAIALLIYVLAFILNIFCNGSIIWCLFPFIHADLTSFLGGATMQTGFLKTSLYAYGNFYISLTYYLVIVVLLYNFTKQLFKKN